MTYQKLKQKIYLSLGLGTPGAAVSDGIYEDVSNSLPDAVNSAARNVSSITGCIKKRASLTFCKSGEYSTAEAPDDLCAVVSVSSGGRLFAPQCFEVMGAEIVTAADIGLADMIYTAYPADVTGAADSFELEYADIYADAIALGAAMDLCAVAYPGDYNRYLSLATEYDALTSDLCAISYGGRCRTVVNSLFSGRRVNI